MLEGFIGGLIIAWILTLFGIDKMVIEVIQPFVKATVITTSFYYIGFGVIGAIGGFFKKN